ncbi:MAG TPA: sugar transferase [Solirubrobacteraceae bacterium]|nr:sugar transferase [Solirubrobacteraceae bacterium]
MTPPPAATHAAQPTSLSAPSRTLGRDLAGLLTAHIVEPRMWARTRFLVDLLMLTLAASAAVFAAPDLHTGPNRLLAAVFPLVAIVSLHARRNRDERLQTSILDTGTVMIGAVSSAAILTMALATVVGAAHPIGLTLRLWLFAIVYAGVARAVLVSVRAQALSNRALAVPTLIVGAGSVGELVVKRISEDPRYGLQPVGFLDADPMPIVASGVGRPAVPILGAESDLGTAVARTGARRVILAFSSQPDHAVVDQIRECQQLGVGVSLVPRLFESINGRATLDHLGGLPLLSLRPTDPRGWQFAVKHTLDRTVALVALIMAAPLMAAIAIAIRATSPGGALFRQRRIGRDGRAFDLLKFRTMREGDGADAFQLPSGCAPGGVEGHDRRTRLGLFLRESSLDELPQLINVLRGDMSLVGPRPERPEFVERFTSEVNRYQDRHRVKSGITGWAQVHGLRGQTSIADRVEWDNYYIQNWSLSLDLRIIALTIAEILRLRGDEARPDSQ